jgi:hypothetical protein
MLEALVKDQNTYLKELLLKITNILASLSKVKL